MELKFRELFYLFDGASMFYGTIETKWAGSKNPIMQYTNLSDKESQLPRPKGRSL